MAWNSWKLKHEHGPSQPSRPARGVVLGHGNYAFLVLIGSGYRIFVDIKMVNPLGDSDVDTDT